jgi:hypothetical protein
MMTENLLKATSLADRRGIGAGLPLAGGGTIPALAGGDLRIARGGRGFMPDVCDQCGSGVSKKLLRCSDGTAVFHRECAKGHKQHRISGKSEQPAADREQASGFFVIVESCDCN